MKYKKYFDQNYIFARINETSISFNHNKIESKEQFNYNQHYIHNNVFLFSFSLCYTL
jgi:hypothetical protein